MAPPVSAAALLSPESVSAAGLSADRLNLPLLQSKMKADPSLYEPELQLLVRHFESSLDLFRHQSALNPSSDPVIAKNLGDLTMVLAHLAPFYPDKLNRFPSQIADLLGSDGRDLPSSLRLHLVQALILLINRKIVELEETLELFMNLQIIGDRAVRKLAFSHVVHSIRRMNQKHKNETKNRKLQSILFKILQGEEELRSKRALTILCELHRRKVWFDENTANAICFACFHTSNRIRVAALSFLLGYETVAEDADSDASDTEDDNSNENPHVLLSKEDIYKANKKGTSASKKKKKAKLKRVVRSMKRQQRISSENSGSNYYSPLTYLKDPQGFAEKLLSQHKDGKAKTERFEVKMMRLRVICRTVGLHRLILLPLYDDLENYAKPHQRDVTILLAAAVQACHDMVPPDAVEPLFKSIVNSFVHDKSSPEAITVGLNVVREICLRMPLLMNEDLLQDLVMYKKTRNKGVSIAARSLVSLFREICPSLLVKKDRGRPVNPNAKPKAYGETSVSTDVPDLELLQEPDDISSDADVSEDEPLDDVDGNLQLDGDEESDDAEPTDGDDVMSDDDEGLDDDDDVTLDGDDVSEDDEPLDLDDVEDDKDESGKKGEKKRKLDINAADTSLRALKKLAMAINKPADVALEDGILSNEDFQRIREIKAKKEANSALVQHGLRNTDKLSMKPLDPSKLQAHVKRKMTKEERLEMVKAGREDRDPYRPRAAVKKKKTGGTSNAEKKRRKKAPLAVGRVKARSRNQNKNKKKNTGKQFRGRKAWK